MKKQLLPVVCIPRIVVSLFWVSLLFSSQFGRAQIVCVISQEDSIVYRKYLDKDMPLRTDVILLKEFYRSIGYENRVGMTNSFQDAYRRSFSTEEYHDPPTVELKKILKAQFETLHKDEVAFERGKQELIEKLKAYSQEANDKPIFFADIEMKFGGDIEKYVHHLYENSIMGNRKKFKRFLRSPYSWKIQKDPGFQFSLGLILYEMALQGTY